MVLYLVGVVVAAIVLLLIGWYRTCYAPYQVYKSSGLPQPPLTPFFGNTLQLVNQGYLECMDKWITKYGKILIYYVGANPTIMVADPDMLKEITVKHFNKFTDRVTFSNSINVKYHILCSKNLTHSKLFEENSHQVYW
jgi:hypothetical protein